MKICPKCGKQLPDEARFCGNCGCRIEVDPNSSERKSGSHANDPNRAEKSIKPARNKSHKGRIFAVAVVVAVIGIAAAVMMVFMSNGEGGGTQELTRQYSVTSGVFCSVQTNDSGEYTEYFSFETLPVPLYLSSYYVFEYDSSGNMVCETCYDAEGEETSASEHEYDDDGNLIRVTVSFSSYSSYIYIYEYEYDEEGNQIQYTLILMDPDTGEETVDTITVFEYDEDGNEISSEKYDGNGDLSSYTSANYNTDGTISSFSVYDMDGEYQYDSLIYQYDSDGNLTYKLLQSTTSSTLMIYDTDGNVTTSYISDSLLNIYEVYLYDSNGNLTGYQSLDYDGEPEYSFTYTYDSSGNMLTAVMYDEDEEEQGSFYFNYDDDSRYSTASVYDSEDVCIGEFVYEYDEDGGLSVEWEGDEDVTEYSASKDDE